MHVSARLLVAPICLLGSALNAQGTSARTIQFNGSSTRVEVWKDGAKEMFRVSLNGGASWHPATEADTRVMLGYAEFDPTAGEPAVAGLLTAPAAARSFILQLNAVPLPATLQALRENGIEVLQYVAHQAYLVRMDPAGLAGARALPFVRWVGRFHPAYKLEDALVRGLVGGALPAGASKYDISVMNRFGGDQAALVAAVPRIGGVVVTAPEGRYMIEAMLTPAQLVAVAAEDTVMSVSAATPIGFDITNARVVGGANYVETKKPSGYTGKGIRGMTMEGIYPTHPEDVANAHRGTPIVLNDASPDAHGNATFGEIFSNGVNPQCRGILPDAQGIFCNANYVSGNNNRYQLTKDLVDPTKQYQGMFQTASWGYNPTTVYTDRSREMDIILFDFDLPVSNSQSNQGSRNSRPQAWAKNIISGGGLNHYDNVNPADDRYTSASIGPASDGRIKPDLCAFYDAIYTTNTATNYQTGFGGTSGATPIIAGYVGFSIELFTDGLFGHPLPGASRFANRPHMTTTKAHLINTARQYPFTQATITRYNQGWGFPSVQDMYDLRDKTHVVNETDVLDPLQTKEYWFFVGAAEPQLRMTLTWADPAALANSTVNQINNLDLQVTAPNATVYWGNNGLKTANYSVAGGSADTVDTLENVFVKDPAPGVWRANVTAARIATDGHVETSKVDADYAFVASGISSGRSGTMKLEMTTTPSQGDLTIKLTGLPATWTSGWTLLSFDASQPAGLGSFLGIEFDAMSGACLGSPIGVGNPLRFPFTTQGNAFPNAPFAVPPGSLNGLKGLSMDGVSLVVDATGNVVSVSNAARVTF